MLIGAPVALPWGGAGGSHLQCIRYQRGAVGVETHYGRENPIWARLWDQ